MISHNKTSEQRKWRRSKAKIIQRFGTVRAAAHHIGCHYNSIPLAAVGKCPRVAEKLEKQGCL